EFQGQNYKVDLSKPIDISIPLRGSSQNPGAWYLPPPEISPVVMDNFIRRVKEGASTNFNTIVFNPHAHGHHTSCRGHITIHVHSIGDTMEQLHLMSILITIEPTSYQDHLVVTRDQLSKSLSGERPVAVILRTFPKDKVKFNRQYSHTNPAYLLE